MVIPKSSLQLLLSLFYLWLTLAEGPNVSAQTVKPYSFERHHLSTLFNMTHYFANDSVSELATSYAWHKIEHLCTIIAVYLQKSQLSYDSPSPGAGKFVRTSEPGLVILVQAEPIS